MEADQIMIVMFGSGLINFRGGGNGLGGMGARAKFMIVEVGTS